MSWFILNFRGKESKFLKSPLTYVYVLLSHCLFFFFFSLSEAFAVYIFTMLLYCGGFLSSLFSGKFNKVALAEWTVNVLHNTALLHSVKSNMVLPLHRPGPLQSKPFAHVLTRLSVTQKKSNLFGSCEVTGVVILICLSCSRDSYKWEQICKCKCSMLQITKISRWDWEEVL